MLWTLCLWEHHVSERKAHPHLGQSSKSRISNLISSKPNNQNLLALPLASENFRLILFSEDRIESLPKQGPDENKYSGPSMVPGVPNESENALATYFDVAVIRCLFISHWSEDGVFWALMFLTRRWVLLERVKSSWLIIIPTYFFSLSSNWRYWCCCSIRHSP